MALTRTRPALVLLLLALSAPAGAATGTATAGTDGQRPADAAQELKKLERDLKQGEERKEALDAQAEALEKELADLRARAIQAAEEGRREEAALDALERRLAELSADEGERVARIEADRAALTELLGALQRLTRLPPDALIARPEAPAETVKSALLLRAAIPELKLRADNLARELGELAQLRTDLAARRKEAGAAVAGLEQRQAELRTLVARREALARRTVAERDRLATRLTEMAGRAGDLKELIEKLEAERKAAQERERAAEAARRATAEAAREKRARDKVAALERAPVPPKSGGLLMPVGGEIETRYGQTDRFGTTSRGVTFRGRAAASVVAPADGTVIFAGPFKGYGLILILELANGYHSLLAGLGRADADVGQRVLVGEPVGTLKDEPKPTLYFELRRGGQPVNPLRAPQSDNARTGGKGQG